MSTTTSSHLPAEWVGDHYRPIGGSYETLELAVGAVEAHYRNRHGSVGAVRVFKPDNPGSSVALIELGPDVSDPLSVRAIYKVVAVPTAR